MTPANIHPAALAVYWRENARMRREAAEKHPDHPQAEVWIMLAAAADKRAASLEKEAANETR